MASTAYEIVKCRMGTLGIALGKYADPGAEINSWANGFNFVPKTDWKEFASALTSSGRFCVDTGLAARLQKGALSWREIASGDRSGMHVLYRKGKPYKEYPKVVSYFQIHIDSISPTSQRTGRIASYGLQDLDNIWNHAAVDLLHLPIVLPSKEEGLRLGVRF